MDARFSTAIQMSSLIWDVRMSQHARVFVYVWSRSLLVLWFADLLVGNQSSMEYPLYPYKLVQPNVCAITYIACTIQDYHKESL